MLVIKFGGTSLADAAAIERAYEIVRFRLEKRPVVVVSAAAGVTDALFAAALDAARGVVAFDALIERHRRLARSLGLTPSLVERALERLHELLRGIAAVGELSPRVQDAVVSYGERLSALLVSSYFARRGLESVPLQADDIGLMTDSRFGRARPLAGIYATIRRHLVGTRGIPVITGYIGRDIHGNVTTLGRSGSDFTAAIVGRAIRASEIQIWTDVDGILTADPRLVPSARPLGVISFEEACELARGGARVLHPEAIEPAIEGRIPVRVLNSRKPRSEGTRIVDSVEADRSPVTAIVHRTRVNLVTASSVRGAPMEDVLRAVLDAAKRWAVPIDLLVTSSASVSILVPADADLTPMTAEISPRARVEILRARASLALIGPGAGTDQRVFSALTSVLERIPGALDAASVTGRGTALTAVVEDARVEGLVRALHGELVDHGLLQGPSMPSKKSSEDSRPSRNS